MAVDFDALRLAVEDAQREAEEATAAKDALTAVGEQLAEVQESVNVAIEAANKESTEASAALQKIIDIVQARI